MSQRPLFTAAGIPVSFDPFFLVGAFLVYTWAGGGRPGGFTVVAMVVFTVIHEFGHALTARAFGAQPIIHITFLAGFASYAPTSRMTTRHNVAISAAGPGIEFLTALPVLWFAIRGIENASSMAEAQLYVDVYRAVAWAGILLAFLNLVPLLPLDGGHIARSLLVRAFGDRVVRPYLYASIALALVMGVLYLARRANPDIAIVPTLPVQDFGSLSSAVLNELRSLPDLLLGGTLFIPIFVAFGAYTELQRSGGGQRFTVTNAPSKSEMSHADSVRAAASAERNAWATGRVGDYPRRWSPSPWVLAHVAMVEQRRDEAVRRLGDLADGRPRNWLVDRPDRPEIGQLLEMVPPAATHSLAVLEARVHHGSAEDLVADATARFIDEQSAEPLYLGACGLAVRGFDDEAIAWLRRAIAVAPDSQRIATAPELRTLHRRSEFQQLLGEAERAATN